MTPVFRLLLATLLLSPSIAQAAELQIEGAWSRASIGAGTTGAVFMEIGNPGAEAVLLTGAQTDAAATAELHSHEMDEGIMRMRQVPSVEVPAGGAVAFAPGGYHVMLFGMTRKLTEGESFDLTLQSAAGETFHTAVTVMAPTFMGPEHMNHEHMNHEHMNHEHMTMTR